MALKLQVSNSLTRLANALSADIKSMKIGVFQLNYIVTQTDGMNSWLKLRLAENVGIAANNQFLKPNDLVHVVYRMLGGQFLQPLSSANQCWLLYKLLAEQEFTSRFRDIAEYYQNSGPERDLKRMALAEKVADLFDQYQIYRPEMIRKWNLQSLQEVQAGEWQQYLWIKARQLSGERLPDKTVIGNYIIEELKKPEQQANLRSKMPACHLFGLSVTTTYHIQLFHEIGRFTDLVFHLLNPAPGTYWFEDRNEKQVALLKKKGFLESSESSSGNSLLTGWGKVIQNTFSLLFQNDDLLNSYEELDLLEPEPESLLQIVQQDIFYNRSDEEREALSASDLIDGSLTINSCYTPAREVEVLYSYLIHLIDQRKETLSPRDIVVMVSDIDSYAPYIRAVFDNAPYSFPFTIADESYTANESISSALKSLLSMSADNFKAEEVLQILDSGFIRQRFGISDINLIRSVVEAANIHTGLEGSREDDTVYVSWKYGLKRIIFGICMSGEDELLLEDESLYPLDRLEGANALELVRFCHFIDVLIDAIVERSKNRSLADWALYIERLLHNLIIEPGQDVDDDYAMLLETLEKYALLNGILTEDISFDVFNHSFTQSLAGAVRSGSFALGGITFCSLIPMRSIPFKVVCLLGLDFDKFPRPENPLSFNLMEKEKRKGDRNVKENDKHLFLETLLSAQQYLYISYVGQSVKDNSSIPPSALIDELIEYIQTKSDLNAAESLITRHPISSFSNRYQQGSPRLYDYLNQPNPVLSLIASESKDPLKFEEVSIDDLISFFKHPVKTYYNKVLGIYYREDDVLLSDTEIFELDSLQQWALKQKLLKISDSTEREILRDRMLKTGMLPLKNMSLIALDTIEQTVVPVRELFLGYVGDAVEDRLSIILDIPEHDLSIRGILKNVYDTNLITVCWSKDETKYLLEAYIRYLIAIAAGIEIGLVFFSSKNQTPIEGIRLRRGEAYSRLVDLIEIYKRGHQGTLPFWTDFGIRLKDIPAMEQEEFLKKVSGKFNGDYSSNDYYMINKYREGFFSREESFEQYMELAKVLLLPLAEIFPDYSI